MTSTPIIRIQTIEDAETFERLREPWTELVAASASDGLFLTWEWLFTWWKHLAEDRELSIRVVRSRGDIIAIAPLAIRRKRLAGVLPVRSLEFLGTGAVGSDYLDIIVRRGHERVVVPALVEHLTREGVMLDLGQIDRSSGVASALESALRARGWARGEPSTVVCPFIDLRGHSWASYVATLGADHRYNLQRRLRNAARQFDLRFEPARAEPERTRDLAMLLRLHDLRFGERSDAFHTPALRAFHDDVSRTALAQGALRLFLLSLDGRPAAALYGFRHRERFYFYQSGFDPTYAKWSVGLLAMALAIKSAIEEGAEEYDLLHGDEPYKFHWARRTRQLERLELYPPTVRDRIRRRARGANRSARRLARRLLPETVVERIATARRVGVWRTLGAVRPL